MGSDPLIVGLTGYKQSGKDTFARVLIERGGFVRVAFADALKMEVAKWCGITMTQLEAEKEQLRRVLQLRGTARRMERASYWTDLARVSILALMSVGSGIVITDVRYPNEATMIRELGGTIVRMRRMDQPYVTEDTHPSETSVDLITPDTTVMCSSIAQREAAALEMLKEMNLG